MDERDWRSCNSIDPFYMYSGSVEAIVAREQAAMSSTLDTVDLRLNSRFDFARGDVLFLSKTPPITGIMRARANGGADPLDGSSEVLRETRLAALFSAMLGSRPEYTQFRYIGVKDGGREIVRVDRTIDGEIRRVPVEDVRRQHRWHRFEVVI